MKLLHSFVRNLVNHVDESKKQVWTLKAAFKDYVNHFTPRHVHRPTRRAPMDVLAIHLRRTPLLPVGAYRSVTSSPTTWPPATGRSKGRRHCCLRLAHGRRLALLFIDKLDYARNVDRARSRYRAPSSPQPGATVDSRGQRKLSHRPETVPRSPPNRHCRSYRRCARSRVQRRKSPRSSSIITATFFEKSRDALKTFLRSPRYRAGVR